MTSASNNIWAIMGAKLNSGTIFPWNP